MLWRKTKLARTIGTQVRVCRKFVLWIMVVRKHIAKVVEFGKTPERVGEQCT